MSLKDMIVQWSQGVDKALDGKFEEAIDIWTAMQEPGARICFNVGCMHLLLGNLDNAERVGDSIIIIHSLLAHFNRIIMEIAICTAGSCI